MRRFEGQSPRQTRIVATVGLCPKRWSWPEYLDRLALAGVDVLRLNMSHADRDHGKEAEIMAWANAPMAVGTQPRVALLVDLQGPKARIGQPAGGALELAEGDVIVLSPSPIDEPAPADGPPPRHVPMSAEVASAVCRSLARLRRDQPAKTGRLRFGDGEVEAVVSAFGDDQVRATVSAGGRLSARKGLTIFGVDIDLDPFSDKDRHDLAFALGHGTDFVAVSFVREAHDIERVQAFIAERVADPERRPRVIAKIETLSAVDHIDGILEAADGIMIARGDLGMQLGVAEVPALQKRLALHSRQHNKPVIVATQMLESMIHNPAPTRAEATDVFNAILDGGDAVMLSGETSVGERPCETVEMIDTLARRAEAWRREPEWLKRDRKAMRRHARQRAGDPQIGRINEEFALTAVQFGEHIPAGAVVCATRSGGTPRRLSRYRPAIPLLALCADPAVARRLLLFYGVHPVLLDALLADDCGFERLVELGGELCVRDLGLHAGDIMVFTAGVNWPRGGTNSMRVARV